MIKVAFCDDELSVLNELSVLMDRYRVERNREIGYIAFQISLNLMAEIEKGVSVSNQPGYGVGEQIICAIVQRYRGRILSRFRTDSSFSVSSFDLKCIYGRAADSVPFWYDSGGAPLFCVNVTYDINRRLPVHF